MLDEATRINLAAMKLTGMAEAYEEQRTQSCMLELTFEERFALPVERQWIWKENRSMQPRLSYARLKEPASLVGMECPVTPNAGSQRSVVEQLARCDWVRFHQNVIVTWPRAPVRPTWPVRWPNEPFGRA